MADSHCDSFSYNLTRYWGMLSQMWVNKGWIMMEMLKGKT